MNFKPFFGIVVLSILLVNPFFISFVSAQAESNYYITIKPTTLDSPMYTAIGRNWTVSFEAVWSYGVDSGKPIQNATAIVEITNNENQKVGEIPVKTDSAGIVSFNYSSPTATILTFTPVKLISHDGKEWPVDSVDAANNVYGLQSKSVVVWWDTFHVSLVSPDTSTQGDAAVTVNVTYVLLPEEGLTLPKGTTYSNQTLLPKIVQGANVTINGVKAQETQEPGIYSTNVPIWLPTTYVLVTVSHEGWITTNTGFSFAHQANEPIWVYTIVFSSIFGMAILLSFIFIFRKTNKPLLFTKQNFPIYGASFLAIISIISFYWGLVWLDGSLHGFGWILPAVLGMLSFAFGIVGSIVSLRKKYQAVAIAAVIGPMLTNLVGIKSSFAMYQLANPWLLIIISLCLSIISGILLCNSDKYFKNKDLS